MIAYRCVLRMYHHLKAKVNIQTNQKVQEINNEFSRNGILLFRREKETLKTFLQLYILFIKPVYFICTYVCVCLTYYKLYRSGIKH